MKFEIKVSLKTFEIGERIVENNWLTGKLTGRLAFAIVDELYYLNDVSIFILHVLFSLAKTTRLAWWPCSPVLGNNFPSLSMYLDTAYFTENWKLKIIKKYISINVYSQNYCLFTGLYYSCLINSTTRVGLKKSTIHVS